MSKTLGATLLIAGTCIGAGMVSLPLILSKIGILPSLAVIVFTWSVIFFSALISVELNLQAGKGLNLGDLGRHFSGPIAGKIGDISIMLLSYSILSLFIYCISDVLNTLSGLPTSEIALYTGIISIIIIGQKTKIVDYFNRILFAFLIISIALLIVGIFMELSPAEIPLTAAGYNNITAWKDVTSAVFLSLGFQVVFHTLTDYCNKDAKMLRKAFFWGSIIPVVISLIWTAGVIGIIHNQDVWFYARMVKGDIDIGEMVSALNKSAKWPIIQVISWYFSILASITSVLGVGLGLCTSITRQVTENRIVKSKSNTQLVNIISAALAVVPPMLIVILVPNVFFTILGFAGMILTVIAIILPIYLLRKGNFKKLNYPILGNKILIYIALSLGAVIIISELLNHLA